MVHTFYMTALLLVGIVPRGVFLQQDPPILWHEPIYTEVNGWMLDSLRGYGGEDDMLYTGLATVPRETGTSEDSCMYISMYGTTKTTSLKSQLYATVWKKKLDVPAPLPDSAGFDVRVLSVFPREASFKVSISFLLCDGRTFQLITGYFWAPSEEWGTFTLRTKSGTQFDTCKITNFSLSINIRARLDSAESDICGNRAFDRHVSFQVFQK